MGFKENFEKEKRELQSVNRPYETVAFLIFGLMFIQNIVFLVVQIINYFQTNFWNFGNFLTRMNNAAFIMRFSAIFVNKPFLQMLVAILLFGLYWFLIYYFVWNYCKKNKLAKWTWTLFVVYGPGVFLATPLIFFVIYVFRPYFARFAKRFVMEFKSFDPNHEFEEEKMNEFNESDYDKYITPEEKQEVSNQPENQTEKKDEE